MRLQKSQLQLLSQDRKPSTSGQTPISQSEQFLGTAKVQRGPLAETSEVGESLTKGFSLIWPKSRSGISLLPGLSSPQTSIGASVQALARDILLITGHGHGPTICGRIQATILWV